MTSLNPTDQLSQVHEWSKRFDPEALGNVISAMGDPNWQVRQAAVAGLQAHSEVIGDVLRAMKEHHRDLGVLNGAISVLTQSGFDVVVSLCDFLTGPDVELRTYSAIVLGDRCDPRAIPPLLRALEDPDTNVRFHVIEALGKLRAGAAAEALTTIAESKDFSLAFPALAALATIGDGHVVHRLVPLLNDELLQPAIIDTLGCLGDEETAGRLIALLDDANAPVATIASAIVALATRHQESCGDRDFIPELFRKTIAPEGVRRLLSDTAHSGDGTSIVAILGWLVAPEADAILASLLDRAEIRDAAADVLVRRGSKSLPVFLSRLASDDLEMRRVAVHALGRIGDRQAVPALLAELESDGDLTVAIAGALAMIGDPRPYATFMDLLGHADAAIRQAAISTLSALGHPQMSVDSAVLLNDANPLVRESAVRIAAYFAFPGSADALFERCGDAHRNVRRAAVECASRSDDPRALSILLKSLADEAPQVRAAAARGLAHFRSDEARHGLEAALADDDPWVRYSAARSTGLTSGRRAAETLRTLTLQDHAMQVRVAATEALGHVGGSDDVALLASLSESNDGDLSRAALGALGGIASAEALALLSAASLSSVPARRLHAVRALGSSGDPSATAALRRATGDGDASVVREALDALQRLATSDAMNALVERTAHPWWRDMCIAALARQGEADGTWIAFGLVHDNVDVRRSVVAALGRMRGPAAVEHLKVAAGDAAPSVRFAAIQALALAGLTERTETIRPNECEG